MMSEWDEDHLLANLRIFQANSARKSWLGVDGHSGRAFLSELIVA